MTRRRILPLKEMTIEATPDVNALAAIGTTIGLSTNPKGDQEADPSPDVKEVTPNAGGTQEVLLIHILLEGISQAEGPGHDPDPELGPGPDLIEEGQGLIPTIVN